MLWIHLRSALRSLRRNRTYSLLNIFGLAIGMAACIVILLFVYYEGSFDRMRHRNLYRLDASERFTSTGSVEKMATTMFPMGPTMKAAFPEILNYSRVDLNTQYEMTYGDKRLFLPRACFVDSSFLRMLDFPLLEGDRQTALLQPNSIVLTETAARELFGNVRAVGKTVSHFGEDTLVLTVTGILQDLPANTQFQFDALQSFSTVSRPKWMDRWSEHWVNTYLELAPNTDVAALEKRFPAYLAGHHVSTDQIEYGLFLQPLRDVHANSIDIGDDDINYQKFDRRYVEIFIVIGLLVLVIACINYTNLATAQSAERAKEVGIRKASGALRSQLGAQFLLESVLLSLMAMLVALALVRLALPLIDQLSGRNLSPIFPGHPELLAAIFVGTVVLGVLSGLYPAVYLSSFRPIKVLKGASERGKGRFRNMLVVAQFSSAIFLIAATILVFRQVNYIMTQDPGFDRDQVVTIPLHGITNNKYHLLKEELSASPLVAGVTGAHYQLGGQVGALGYGFWAGNRPMRVLFTSGMMVDPDYISLYRIPLLAGRNFSHATSAGGNESIINETLARELLKDQPDKPLSWLIGKHFGGDTLGSIVGVVRDFNFNSLHYKIEPIFLMNEPQWNFSSMSVKISGRQASRSMDFLRATWKKVLPAYPFDYEFLDDHFRALYRTDMQVSRMVSIMAGLAILISCLGLFGLASFATERRTKEIGIRKVLGASVRDVAVLLSGRLLALVLLANLIAWPLAWLALHRWIEQYAYRVALSWWVFVAAGLAAMLVAAATVGFRTLNAATANPVRALRTE